MNEVFQIAWREYKQYVFSRGFLLFLVMFPLGFLGVSAALALMEANKPLRHYTVIDETGVYIQSIQDEIERRRMRNALRAWDAYVTLNADVDAVPAPFAPDDIGDARLAAFREAGGFSGARAAVAPALRENAPVFHEPQAAYRFIAPPDEAANAKSLGEAEAALRPYLLDDRKLRDDRGAERSLFAAVLIPSDFGAGEGAGEAQYWSRNLTDAALADYINSALNSALRRERLAEVGVSAETLDAIGAINAPVGAFRPDRAPEEAELGLEDRIETALPAALTYMLLVIIFGVGNLLLTNTIEERSNKIVEVLLSSVTANQLMAGKLLGIGAVGLTMPAVFLTSGVAIGLTATASGEPGVISSGMAALFGSPLVLIYLFYFLCAYVIFAMIFLAIGAVSNSLQDAQSYMGPVMLIVFAPLPFMLMVFDNPNGFVASVLTWIPIYTPYAVLMRAAADPPLGEILGATALMLVFALFMMRIMGRIFRHAILQAAPAKVSDLVRLTRRSEH